MSIARDFSALANESCFILSKVQTLNALTCSLGRRSKRLELVMRGDKNKVIGEG